MYRGFNLEIEKSERQKFFEVTEEDLRNFESKLSNIVETVKSSLRESVEISFNDDGDIDGNELISTWFPTIDKVDVFISHSHNDSRTAKRLAIWLQEKFNLHVFLDFQVWGSADDLLKEIDNRFSHLRTGKDGTKTYSYDKRNYTTSHIHMMLVSALMEMVHKAELVIFLNTPNSIKPGDIEVRKTNSPWIFSELTIASIIEKTKPVRYSNKIYERTIKSNKYLAEVWNFNISYDVENKLSKYFPNLTLLDLEIWASKYGELKTQQTEYIHPLDALYKIKSMNIYGDEHND